jgi:hypothetical protein
MVFAVCFAGCWSRNFTHWLEQFVFEVDVTAQLIMVGHTDFREPKIGDGVTTEHFA